MRVKEVVFLLLKEAKVSVFDSIVQIGFFCCGNYFDGDIPVVKIYNRALSASEILSNYRALKSRYGH